MTFTPYDKLVRDAGGHDDDVSRPGIDRLGPEDEGHLPSLHDEDLLVGMTVKAGAVPHLDVAEEEGDRRTVLMTMEDLRAFAPGKFVGSNQALILQLRRVTCAGGFRVR
jgi:hypothetical protein